MMLTILERLKISSCCPICKGRTLKFFSHNDYFGKKVKLRKCVECGHGFYNKVYSANQVASLYNQEYATEYLDSSNEHKARQLQYVQDVKFILPYINREIDVIDIGCSSGEFLDEMPSVWNKHGMEVNDFLRKKLIDRRQNYTIFEDLKSIDKQFDLVTLRGVIEHIVNHADLLKFLDNKLRRGGMLYICATPNFDSVCARLYRDKWSQVTCPEHIHQFTPTSVQYLLAQANLTLKIVEYPYLETPYANWREDSASFLKNYLEIQRRAENKIDRHPFPGNMMSLVFEKA